VAKYKNRISGPLLDRIDIQCEILPVPFDKLSSQQTGESSATIRARVIKARNIQAERYKNEPQIHCNAQITSRLMRQYCALTDDCMAIIEQAMTHYGMSARAYDRILRVARTIADLDGSPDIAARHLREAIGYRNLDRANWGASTPLPF
jgi:magnesium chelatase family protein